MARSPEPVLNDSYGPSAMTRPAVICQGWNTGQHFDQDRARKGRHVNASSRCQAKTRHPSGLCAQHRRLALSSRLPT